MKKQTLLALVLGLGVTSGAISFGAVQFASADDTSPGYVSCRADGYDNEECKDAQNGYAACRADGWDHDVCLNAPGSYALCRFTADHDECMSPQ